MKSKHITAVLLQPDSWSVPPQSPVILAGSMQWETERAGGGGGKRNEVKDKDGEGQECRRGGLTEMERDGDGGE